MAINIGPKIGIDGEKQFRQELNNINQQLKTLGSEMKAVASSFADGADEQERITAQTSVLNRQIDTQRRKLEQLEKGLRASAEKYGESDVKTQKWKQAVYDATAELNRMEKSLVDVVDGLDDMGDKADDTAGSLGDLGGTLKKGLAVGAVVGGVKQLADALFDVTDQAIEYNKVMGALEVSSKSAGYTAAETEAAYVRLYGVLGDQQSAATTVANLQAIGLEQESLIQLIDMTTGAWAKYGDSIPIDGLSEAINETIQASKVTGNFADVINWAGTSEDEFNAKLQAANTTAERAQLVMDELAKQGLTDIAEGYRTAQEEVIKANEAQAEYEKIVSDLGEKLLPARTALVKFATDGWDVLSGSIQTAINLFKEAQALFAKESELRKDGFFVSQDDRMSAYGYEKYYTDEGLLRYRKSDIVASESQRAAITSGGASGTDSAAESGGDIVLNITNEVGGVAVARHQYTYNKAEAQRRGTSLVKSGG